MGRAVSVCPDAILDDGLLDFTLLTGRMHERVGRGSVCAEGGGLGLGGGVGCDYLVWHWARMG
jgi:hypothetical protein